MGNSVFRLIVLPVFPDPDIGQEYVTEITALHGGIGGEIDLFQRYVFQPGIGQPLHLDPQLIAGSGNAADLQVPEKGRDLRFRRNGRGLIKCGYLDGRTGNMADPDIASLAKERGVTRATVSMEKAASLSKKCIFAIGNAPTALIAIKELMDAGKLSPALIIGVPVGFVNVVESKELIIESNVPYIVAGGRKGGSNVAAAIVNALLYKIER